MALIVFIRIVTIPSILGVILLTLPLFTPDASGGSDPGFTVSIEHEIPAEGVVKPGIYTFIAAEDQPADEEMTCRWYFDGIEMWEGDEFQAYVAPGDHSLVLEASNGTFTSTTLINFTAGPAATEVSGHHAFFWISMGLMVAAAISLFAFMVFMVHEKIGSRGSNRPTQGMNAGSIRNSGSGDISCDICLMPLSGDGEILECRCGASFHHGCGRREGVCPDCGREIMI